MLIGQSSYDFVQLDRHVAITPDSIEKNIATLTTYLVRPAKNDLEKVRSLYQWIIRNIDYDNEAYKKGNKRLNRSNEDILERRQAICWGYSTLFKAMCNQSGIPCEIISGYSKTSFTVLPKLEKPNHAWNSVKIDGQWYFVDGTWDSGSFGIKSDFEKEFGYDYFLTPPIYFIVNHLPSDPNWQLLDCLISLEEYQLPPEQLVTLAKRTDCKSNDELEKIELYPINDKRLATAIESYKFNPTKTNQRELAHAQIDYEAYLSEIAERLQKEQKIDSLLSIQLKMIRLCETAAQLTNLFTIQLENCAYNYFNYAITLTQVTTNDKKSSLQKWQTVLNYFEKAKVQIDNLEQNIFTENALYQCKDYMEYVKKQIEALK